MSKEGKGGSLREYKEAASGEGACEKPHEKGGHSQMNTMTTRTAGRQATSGGRREPSFQSIKRILGGKKGCKFGKRGVSSMSCHKWCQGKDEKGGAKDSEYIKLAREKPVAA